MKTEEQKLAESIQIALLALGQQFMDLSNSAPVHIAKMLTILKKYEPEIEMIIHELEPHIEALVKDISTIEEVRKPFYKQLMDKLERIWK